jgi:phosphonate transport system ATP-binding protein
LHQVEYALRYCTRTIALKAGEIVYDGPSRALTPEFLAALYGAESEDLFASIDPRPVPEEPEVHRPSAESSLVPFDLARRAAEQRPHLNA